MMTRRLSIFVNMLSLEQCVRAPIYAAKWEITWKNRLRYRRERALQTSTCLLSHPKFTLPQLVFAARSQRGARKGTAHREHGLLLRRGPERERPPGREEGLREERLRCENAFSPQECTFRSDTITFSDIFVLRNVATFHQCWRLWFYQSRAPGAATCCGGGCGA